MALAEYFAKDLLAINQVLKQPTDLHTILDKITVGIYFSENAVSNREGVIGVELLVRLLARLYPTLRIESLSAKGKVLENEMKALAMEINHLIDIPENNGVADIAVVVGTITEKVKAEHKLYIGSDKWLGTFSTADSKACGNSALPFGIGLVSCIAASNIFRIVFNEFLNEVNKPDEDFTLSALDFSLGEKSYNPELKNIEFQKTTLVGVGAIGSAVAWTLSKLPISSGSIDFVDHEPLGKTNLQRYILFTEKDVPRLKTESAKEFFNKSQLEVHSHPVTWAQYLMEKNFQPISRVAIAVDNKEDRIMIQSGLPKTITNSFTDFNVLRVAKHLDFNDQYACVACGFVTDEKLPNYTDKVASDLNIVESPNPFIPRGTEVINSFLNNQFAVDQVVFFNNVPIPFNLLDYISQKNNIKREELNRYNGMQVRQFHTDFICGGISLMVNKPDQVSKNVEAPLAFQSALAGILLAAELVMQDSGVRIDTPKQAVQFFALNPIKHEVNPQLMNLPKNKTKRCLCADPDFKERYSEKWATEIKK